MTSATETSWHSPRADRAARVRRLDTIAALLIGAVGLGLALAAIAEFAMLYEVGTCPSGHYCTFVQGITVLQLITGVLALVLAAGIAAAALLLFVSVFGERDRTHPPPRGPS